MRDFIFSPYFYLRSFRDHSRSVKAYLSACKNDRPESEKELLWDAAWEAFDRTNKYFLRVFALLILSWIVGVLFSVSGLLHIIKSWMH